MRCRFPRPPQPRHLRRRWRQRRRRRRRQVPPVVSLAAVTTLWRTDRWHGLPPTPGRGQRRDGRAAARRGGPPSPKPPPSPLHTSGRPPLGVPAREGNAPPHPSPEGSGGRCKRSSGDGGGDAVSLRALPLQLRRPHRPRPFRRLGRATGRRRRPLAPAAAWWAALRGQLPRRGCRRRHGCRRRLRSLRRCRCRPGAACRRGRGVGGGCRRVRYHHGGRVRRRQGGRQQGTEPSNGRPSGAQVADWPRAIRSGFILRVCGPTNSGQRDKIDAHFIQELRYSHWMKLTVLMVELHGLARGDGTAASKLAKHPQLVTKQVPPHSPARQPSRSASSTSIRG